MTGKQVVVLIFGALPLLAGVLGFAAAVKRWRQVQSFTKGDSTKMKKLEGEILPKDTPLKTFFGEVVYALVELDYEGPSDSRWQSYEYESDFHLKNKSDGETFLSRAHFGEKDLSPKQKFLARFKDASNPVSKMEIFKFINIRRSKKQTHKFTLRANDWMSTELGQLSLETLEKLGFKEVDPRFDEHEADIDDEHQFVITLTYLKKGDILRGLVELNEQKSKPLFYLTDGSLDEYFQKNVGLSSLVGPFILSGIMVGLGALIVHAALVKM